MELNVKIKKLRENATTPSYQTPGAACCDLCCASEGPIPLSPLSRTLIPTGIALDFGEGGREFAALIFARSGQASRRGLALINGVGVVDADYRGEIMVAVVNLGSEPIMIEPGERIAQLGFFPVSRAIFTEVQELDATERGAGGFGHTGV